MTDKELLELAAKAAGIEITPHPNSKLSKVLHFLANGKNWNPLTDDGDALRLAVKLGMVLDTDWNGGSNAGNSKVDFDEPEYAYQEGSGRYDPYAATRRAVVRAAAEIGKKL